MKINLITFNNLPCSTLRINNCLVCSKSVRTLRPIDKRTINYGIETHTLCCFPIPNVVHVDVEGGGKRGRDQILGLFNKYNPQQILLSKSGNNNIHNFYQFFFFSVKYFSKNIQFFFLQKKIRLIVFNNFQNLFPFVAVVLQISSLGHLSWYTRLLIL